MVSIAALWMPILLSSVLVFFASALVWMVLPIHQHDFKKLNEKEGPVLDAVRSWSLRAGVHMFPACDPKSLKESPVAAERMKVGPWGTITLMTEPPNMGKSLGMWVVNLLLIGTAIAFLGTIALPAGSEYMRVFKFVALAAFLAHSGSALTDSIWKGRPWSHAPGAIIDGLIYAALTAGAFAWLWPKVL